MSQRLYQRLCGWFECKKVEHGIIIVYPIHPIRYWALRVSEWEFTYGKHRNIFQQMNRNNIGEVFQMLDAVAEIAQGERFGEPLWNTFPEEPVLLPLPPCLDDAL